MNPDILFIAEARLNINDPEYQTRIEGYNLYSSKTLEKHGYSRLVMIVKTEINVTILEDLMGPDSASIWITLKRRGQKKVNLGGIYREHRLLLQKDDSSSSPAAQTRRWDEITDKWCKAGKKSQCFLLGDLNLDHLKWSNPEAHHTEIVSMVKNKLEVTGFIQLIQVPTRFWPNCEDSLLDQIWSNSPEQVISCQKYCKCSSRP